MLYVLYNQAWSMVWYDVAWTAVVLHGMVSCHTVWLFDYCLYFTAWSIVWTISCLYGMVCGRFPPQLTVSVRPVNAHLTSCIRCFQIEILRVQKAGDLHLGHLKGTVDFFLKKMFGPGVQTRYRGSFFPFTEPSMEVDIWFKGK